VSELSGWTPSERAAKDPRAQTSPVPWWKTAVFYQVYPRSFLDTPIGEWADRGRAYRARFPGRALSGTQGDGVGDLEGIRRRLAYLAQLGVDAIWVSPFFPSPMADFGYDVADYCDVDPLFGSLADFDRLLTEAHEHGLRVIIDFVPNHTSSQHPWFLDARSSRTARHRDFYVWRDPLAPPRADGEPGTPPNDWRATFSDEPAWTWDAATAQWYLHVFLAEQPDLDWSNPEVVSAMQAALRFWLDRGVDGFRIDVVHLIGKDVPTGTDRSASPSPEPSDLTHQVLRDLRELVDSYPGERMMVGEVYILSTRRVAAFYGQGDELHLAFNFPPLYAPWDASAWRQRIDRTAAALDPIDAWPTWVLSNHDNPRHRTRYGGGAERARAAALMLLGLRGTPFLYAGEELGLTDAVVGAHQVVDPGGRDGCRAPVPWDATPDHGWASDEPWLPWPPEAAASSAEAQEADRGSFLHLYRRALAARRSSPALLGGELSWLAGPEGVLVWERSTVDDAVVVAVNMTASPVDLSAVLPGERLVIASSVAGEQGDAAAERGEGRSLARFDGLLHGDAAVWLGTA